MRDSLLERLMERLFGIPKPYALPMKGFSDPGEFTWEDWHAKAKAEHPVRYFLSETFPLWWYRTFIRPISNLKYWIRCHTYNRYHILDLRQPKTNTNDDYRWGWIDDDTRLVFACFSVLVKHVDIRNKSDSETMSIEKEIKFLQADIKKTTSQDTIEGLQRQINCLTEMKALYHYWTVARKEQLREQERLLQDWAKHRAQDKKNNDKTRWHAMNKAEEDFYEIEEEMLIRLMKIRRGLWT